MRIKLSAWKYFLNDLVGNSAQMSSEEIQWKDILQHGWTEMKLSRSVFLLNLTDTFFTFSPIETPNWHIKQKQNVSYLKKQIHRT